MTPDLQKGISTSRRTALYRDHGRLARLSAKRAREQLDAAHLLLLTVANLFLSPRLVCALRASAGETPAVPVNALHIHRTTLVVQW